MRPRGEVVDKVNKAFKLICRRQPKNEEQLLLKNQYNQALNTFGKDQEVVNNLLRVGEFPTDPTLDRLETAAMKRVINTLMNVDEAYMRG